MVDGLEEQSVPIGEDRRDDVDHLGQVGDAHRPAGAHEDIQEGCDGQRVGQVVLLLQAGLLAPLAVPDVPFVVGDADRPVNPLDLARPLDQRLANPQGSLGLVWREDVAPVVVGAGVDVDRVVVDITRQAVDDDAVPVAPAVPAAADQLDRAVQPAQRIGPAAGFGDVLLGGEMADLPVAPHLVAKTPVADVVRLGVAVGAPQIGPVGVLRPVAVLDPRQGLLQRAGAHVQTDVRLGVEGPAVLDELVGAEGIGLLGLPGELGAPRPFFRRTDAVGPVVVADEVAARPAQQRHSSVRARAPERRSENRARRSGASPARRPRRRCTARGAR